MTRAKAPERMPVVLTAVETRAVLARLKGMHWLIASLLYGAGMRLMEAPGRFTRRRGNADPQTQPSPARGEGGLLVKRYGSA
ncbi:MAG: hypothetical protein ACRD8U_07375 [Pyrinomonadaceae bacterium]